MTQAVMDERVVLVTGGAHGIGRTIAQAFALRRARVVIADINRSAGEAVVGQLKDQGLCGAFYEVDLRQPGAAGRMVADTVTEHGSLGVLVNNARSGRRTDLATETEATWEEGMSVTLRAAFFAAQAAIRAMSADGGSIINIGSVVASLVAIESPVYHVAKAGLLQLTRYLAVTAGKHHVQVNAVVPGFIVQDEDRARFEAADNAAFRQRAERCQPTGVVGTSEDVAQAVLWFTSPESRFVTGQCVLVDGALTLQEQSSLLFRADKIRGHDATR